MGKQLSLDAALDAAVWPRCEADAAAAAVGEDRPRRCAAWSAMVVERAGKRGRYAVCARCASELERSGWRALPGRELDGGDR
jgi:hypothetical protein